MCDTTQQQTFYQCNNQLHYSCNYATHLQIPLVLVEDRRSSSQIFVVMIHLDGRCFVVGLHVIRREDFHLGGMLINDHAANNEKPNYAKNTCAQVCQVQEYTKLSVKTLFLNDTAVIFDGAFQTL